MHGMTYGRMESRGVESGRAESGRMELSRADAHLEPGEFNG